MVVPVDPISGGELDIIDAAPGFARFDQLGLAEPVDRLGQGVVPARSDCTDEGGDPGLSEPFGQGDRRVLHPAIPVVHQASSHHQALDSAARHRDTLPVQLQPHPPGAVNHVAGLVDPTNLHQQRLIPQLPGRGQDGFGFTGEWHARGDGVIREGRFWRSHLHHGQRKPRFSTPPPACGKRRHFYYSLSYLITTICSS